MSDLPTNSFFQILAYLLQEGRFVSASLPLQQIPAHLLHFTNILILVWILIQEQGVVGLGDELIIIRPTNLANASQVINAHYIR